MKLSLQISYRYGMLHLFIVMHLILIISLLCFSIAIPATLTYSSYLGGSVMDQGYAVTADGAGNAYITGITESPDFPVTANAINTSLMSTSHTNIFMSKINTYASGSSSLAYSTYLGGHGVDGSDAAYGICLDSSGNIFITGYTGSTDFPVTSNALNTTFQGRLFVGNAFVSEISRNLSGSSSLIYSTYLGGHGTNGGDVGTGICSDSSGNIFIVGFTGSINFPVTSNAYSTTFNDQHMSQAEAFIAIINPKFSGTSSLVYSTYLGGSGDGLSEGDYAQGISIHNGIAYITGFTYSADFPVTSNALSNTNHSVAQTGFVSVLDTKQSGSSSLIYSSYLGGSIRDECQAIAADNNGVVYVTGYTLSTDFPITSNAFSTTLKSTNSEIFVSKINTNFSGRTALLYSSYLGGSGGDKGNGITIDNSGNIFVAGQTGSSDFPITPGGLGYDTSHIMSPDEAFFSKINPNSTETTSLVYSTYLGGNGADGGDCGQGIAIDTAGNIYITGYTGSSDFPVTSNAFDSIYQINLYLERLSKAFLSKFIFRPPVAGFYATPTSGFAPLQVQFIDTSANSPKSWNWDFGDGGMSTTQNPTYSYNSAGTYTVKLVVINPDGTSTTTRYNYIYIISTAGQTLPELLTPPSLKLFIGYGLSSIFNLEDYNHGGKGKTYSIPTNFLSLGTTNGSYLSESAYNSATVGNNTYKITNDLGSSTGNGMVKYSTYRIQKLPIVGLTPGSSWDLNVEDYTYDTSGMALPPSFGNSSALNISNVSNVTAYWINDSVVRITSLQPFNGAIDVDLIASPEIPAGIDQDRECIFVYSNLLSNSTFSTANDTTTWSPMEIPLDRTTMASQQWIPSYTDSAGTQATGVWQFYFADATQGIKSTPKVSNWICITTGQWYTFRIRLVADSTNNSHQALLFGYTNYPGAGTQTDIVGNVLFGVPTVWTWQEAPLLAHGSSTTGYPQFQFKAGGAGSIYVDEVQIINAVPALLEARSNPYFHYLYGQFTTINDTTGWGQQAYFGGTTPASIGVNNGLVVTFDGTTTEGIKWTANNGVQGPLHAYSFPITNLNQDVNVGFTLNIPSGSFNSLGIVLAAAYGVQTTAQQDIGTPPSNLIAAAGVGTLVAGNYYAEGNAINPYYQAQFGLRSDESGVLVINNVDVAMDKDDPNFGDSTLFP